MSDVLIDYLEEGRTIHEPIAQLRLVPTDELEDVDETVEDEDGLADSESYQGEVKEEPMDVDMEHISDKEASKSAHRIRFHSPDFSWLPPLPDTDGSKPSHQLAGTDPRAADVKVDPKDLGPVSAPSSIADRYRTRIPFTSSSLSAQTIHTNPAPPGARRIVTTPPTSLPTLIQTYTDTRGEMSVAIRPNGHRLQALDLLRRQVTTPEDFNPSDSLSGTDTVPSPKYTPIAVPPLPVGVNPDKSGILSQLVHSIHSGNLPPELRERLTSLRPPLPQKGPSGPSFYGPAIRGADTAALLRHQGKQPEAVDEVYAQATWDVGPRGEEKFSRGTLPRGKKIIKHVEGEDAPRQEKRKSVVDLPAGGGGGAASSSGGGGRTTLRLKLGDSASPAPAGGQLPTPPLATPGGTTIRLRVPGSQEPSKSTSPAPLQGSILFSPSHPTPPINGHISPGAVTSTTPQPPSQQATKEADAPNITPTSETSPATGSTPVQPSPHRSSRLSASPQVNSVALHSLPDRDNRSPEPSRAGMMEQRDDIVVDRKPSLSLEPPPDSKRSVSEDTVKLEGGEDMKLEPM